VRRLKGWAPGAALGGGYAASRKVSGWDSWGDAYEGACWMGDINSVLDSPVHVDYLKSYVTDEGFDVPRLIDDAFFKAIKILYNSKCYISASKLLLCFIDAMAFVSYSDSSARNYKKWLDTYVDLTRVGVTSDELWEHRNALVHLTGLDSRKVKAGKVRRCMAYVGTVHNMPSPPVGEVWYNLYDLIMAVIEGIERFLNDYLPDNIDRFVRNYDQIASDTRLLIFEEQGE
jgi:hypothetical protein